MHLYDRALLNERRFVRWAMTRMPRIFRPVKFNATVTGTPQSSHRETERKYSLLHPGQGTENFRARIS